MAKTKGIWHDPVWSKVIAAVILFVLTAAGTYFLELWPTIGRVAWTVGDFLIAKTPVWNWLLILGGILIVAIAAIVISAFNAAGKAKSPALYMTDKFYGVRWKWRYVSGDVDALHCICLKCGLQVYFANVGTYSFFHQVVSKCDDCGAVVGPFDGSYEDLESRVIRMIHRNLRETRGKAEVGPT